jgi:large subunit ribosomal protein L22
MTQTWAKATLKMQKVSPRKARLVTRMIAGRKVEEALNRLTFAATKNAELVKKVLESAIANAEHNYSLDIDELFVKLAYADEGTTLKRGRARARGRHARILKRYAHITVVVALATEQQAS